MTTTLRTGSHGGLFGGIWIIGWLFSVGYLKLTFWYGVLAIVLWPYYLGVAISLVGV